MLATVTILTPFDNPPMNDANAHNPRNATPLNNYSLEPSWDVHRRLNVLSAAHRAEYQPRTELGKRLMAIRRSYIENGGRLLNDEELAEKLREQRGGVRD
jgi:hypothetical protein